MFAARSSPSCVITATCCWRRRCSRRCSAGRSGHRDRRARLSGNRADADRPSRDRATAYDRPRLESARRARARRAPNGRCCARCALGDYDLLIHLTEHPRGLALARLLRPRWSVTRERESALRCGGATSRISTGCPRAPSATRSSRTSTRCGASACIPTRRDRRLVLVPGAAAETKRRHAARRARPGAARIRAGASRLALAVQMLAGRAHGRAARPHRRGRACASSSPVRPTIASARSTTAVLAARAAGHARARREFHRCAVDAGVGRADRARARVRRRRFGADAHRGGDGHAGAGAVRTFERIRVGTLARARSASSHRRSISCRPCGLDGCGGGKVSECLTTLPVERVHAALAVAAGGNPARSGPDAARDHPPALHAARRRRALPRRARWRRCSNATSRSRCTRASGRETKLQLIEPHIVRSALHAVRCGATGASPAPSPARSRATRANLVQSHERAAVLRHLSRPATACMRRGSRNGCTMRRRRCAGASRWTRGTGTRSRWSASCSRARGCARVLCNSKMVRDDIKARFGLPDERLPVLYNAVDSSVFSPELRAHRERIRANARIPDEATAVPAGRLGLSPQRRAGGHRRARPAVHSRLSHRCRRRSQARRPTSGWRREHGVRERVTFAGYQHDVAPFYGAADAFVLPAIYDSLPDAAMEALASGLPVVTSTKSGAAELVRGKRRGIRVRVARCGGAGRTSAGVAGRRRARTAWRERAARSRAADAGRDDAETGAHLQAAARSQRRAQDGRARRCRGQRFGSGDSQARRRRCTAPDGLDSETLPASEAGHRPPVTSRSAPRRQQA